MTLNVLLNLEFEKNLLFCGFLPETKGNDIEFNLGGKKYHLLLYMSDRNNQLSDLGVSFIPGDPEQLKNHITLHCNHLSLEIRIPNIDPEISIALEAGQPTEKIKLLKQEIYEVALVVHNRIIDYSRNIKKQYWLEPLDLNPENFQLFLDNCGIKWSISGNEWRNFPREMNQTINFVVFLPDKNQGINEENWVQLSSFIAQQKPAKMRDVLIANSFKHLAQNNGRLAVVEAVIALESALKQLLPKVILRIPGAPQISENQIDKVLKKAGLMAITEVVLKLIMEPVGLSDDDIKTILNAVKDRNPIIHNAQRTIEISTARQYVHTIQKVIGILEDRATKKVT